MIIKIVVVGENQFTRLYQPDADEMLVGVDGGINYIIQMGLTADLGIGDFDSCNIEEVVMACSKVKVFPKEKEKSDLELAILEVKDLHHEKIVIYNGTGGRLDHFIAILNVLIKYSEANIEVVDEHNLMRIISQPTKLVKRDYKYFSLFALEEGTIISLQGFKYPLTNYHLAIHDNLCLSNELVEDGFLEVNNKKILVIESK
ncbi:MAG TPA: thiamine diphosphokinase [Bacilli bacterium]|nr:thiamine diphosphokinase [Bacilli bacterium]